MVENKNATYENLKNTSHNKIPWIEKEPVPHCRYAGKEYYLLNHMIEVVMDGVLYCVKSIYSPRAFMGHVLDALTMERINRTVT